MAIEYLQSSSAPARIPYDLDPTSAAPLIKDPYTDRGLIRTMPLIGKGLLSPIPTEAASLNASTIENDAVVSLEQVYEIASALSFGGATPLEEQALLAQVDWDSPHPVTDIERRFYIMRTREQVHGPSSKLKRTLFSFMGALSLARRQR